MVQSAKRGARRLEKGVHFDYIPQKINNHGVKTPVYKFLIFRTQPYDASF